MKQKKLNISYIAGFFDGEGDISISSTVKPSKDKNINYVRFNVHLRISQKESDILYQIQNYFGCGSVIGNKKTGIHQWTIHRWEKVKNILDILYPHIIIKQKQADKFYEIYIVNKNKKRGEIKDKIKILELIKELRKMRKYAYTKYDINSLMKDLKEGRLK